MILSVSYKSQYDADAHLSKADCGQTCLSMLANYILNINIPTDSITEYLNDYNQINLDQLIKAAEWMGMGAVHTHGSIDDLYKYIDEGKPVMCLLEYGKVPDSLKQDQAYQSGHFVLIIGYKEHNLYYHDPDFSGANRYKGADIEIDRDQFQYAWNTSVYIGQPYSIIVPLQGREEFMTSEEFIKNYWVPFVKQQRREQHKLLGCYVKKPDPNKAGVAMYSASGSKVKGYKTQEDYEMDGWKAWSDLEVGKGWAL